MEEDQDRDERYRRYKQLLRLAAHDNPNLNERQAARLAAQRMAATYGFGDQELTIQLYENVTDSKNKSTKTTSPHNEKNLKTDLIIAEKTYSSLQEEYQDLYKEFLRLRAQLKLANFAVQNSFCDVLKIKKQLNQHYRDATYNIIDELRYAFHHRWFSSTEAMAVVRITNRNDLLQTLYKCEEIEQKGSRRDRKYRFSLKPKRG